ncbi:hypothetical protein ABBQ32_003339 [Trebouxia sp. C0010 RCD-2024]
MAGVWDYGDDDDIQPLEDSSDEEENKAVSYDNIALLPASKRRKLQKLHRSQKDVELIDLDNEDKEGEGTGSQNIYACNKQTGKKPRGAESDSDLDFEYRPPPKMQKGAASMPLDPIILQNQALLRSFKEAAQEPLMEEILPEPATALNPRHTSAKPQSGVQTDEDSDAEEQDEYAGANSQEAEPLPELEDDSKVVLLLQSKEGKIPLRISKQAALSKLFEPYKQQAIQKGWLPPAKASSVKFTFDGDRLSGTETAEGLDCDDNDIIEVMW